MNPNLKCHFVKQLSLLSSRVLYGYKCELEALQGDINKVKRFITIEDNLVECSLNGAVINDLNKYRQTLKTLYSSPCWGC